MGSKLLQCTEEDDTLDVVASREASRLKRLIQALRYLWRSSILATYSGVIVRQISIFFMVTLKPLSNVKHVFVSKSDQTFYLSM